MLAPERHPSQNGVEPCRSCRPLLSWHFRELSRGLVLPPALLVLLARRSCCRGSLAGRSVVNLVGRVAGGPVTVGPPTAPRGSSCARCRELCSRWRRRWWRWWWCWWFCWWFRCWCVCWGVEVVVGPSKLGRGCLPKAGHGWRGLAASQAAWRRRHHPWRRCLDARTQLPFHVLHDHEKGLRTLGPWASESCPRCRLHLQPRQISATSAVTAAQGEEHSKLVLELLLQLFVCLFAA